MRRVLWVLLPIAVLVLGMIFPAREAMADSIMTKPLFHLSKVRGGEFYTTDLAEKNEMIGSNGYADMGVACYIVGPEADQPSGMVPLYRLKFTGNYQGTTFNEYLYTTSQDEVDEYISKGGWSWDGISGYVSDKDSPLTGTVPLYRWYCPCTYHWHGYSTDIDDTWITKLHQGTLYEGPACWVWDKECAVEIPQRTWQAPYDLKAVNWGEEVRLTWKNSQDNADFISIERKKSDNTFREIAAVKGTTTKYTDDTVLPDTFYTYRVRAYKDGKYSRPSNEVRIYTDNYDQRNRDHKKNREGFPGDDAPLNLRVAVLSYSSVSLTWDNGDFPAMGYRVERRSSIGSWVTIANLGHRTRTFTDTGLDRYTKYHYRVRAYNLLTDSDYSEEVSVCTADHYDKSDDYWPRDNPYYDQPLVIKLQVGSRRYYVNQAPAHMDTAPFITGDRTLVPIRFLAESIGARVDWNDYQKKATIFHDGEVIELWAGRSTAQINGQRTSIDTSNALLTPIIENGRIMLPLRFITENLGFEVHWIDKSQEIILTYFS